MAVTTQGALLTQQHRLAQMALRSATIRDLLLLWPLFDVRDFATFDRFVSAAQLLLGVRHADSIGLAAAYLEAFRAAEGQAGRIEIPRPSPLEPVVIETSLRTGGILGTLNARRAGLSIEAAKRNGFVRVAGAASSLVLDGGRQTILEGVAADPAQPRWQRVPSGRACGFCAMLASRGAVYKSRDRAAFKTHDHCSCTPEPAYAGSRLPEAAQRYRDHWKDATRGLSGTDALNAFRRSLEGGEEPAAAESAA